MELYIYRINKNVLAPHNKYRHLFITEHYRKNLTTFKKFINERFENQPDGIYILKDRNNKAMSRFRIRLGKITKIYKTSPITKERYKLIRKYGL